MNKDKIVGMIIVGILIVVPIIEAIIPTTTSIFDPLGQLIKIPSKIFPPWLPLYYKEIVKTESKNITQIKNKTLYVILNIVAGSLKIATATGQTAYRLTIYKRVHYFEKSSLEIRTSFYDNQSGSILKVTIVGALVELYINPIVLKTITINTSATALEVTLTNLKETNIFVNSHAVSGKLELQYSLVNNTKVFIKSRATSMKIHIILPKNVPVHSELSSSQSMVEEDIDDIHISLTEGVRTFGTKGGLLLKVNAITSMVKISISRW